MAFVRCSKHGGHGAPLLCKHLREAVRLGRKLPTVYYVEAWYLGEPAWGEYICPECARENGISENPTVWRNDDGLDRIFAMDCGVSPVCPICFDEAKQRQAF